MSGRVGAEQTPDIEAVISEVLEGFLRPQREHYAGHEWVIPSHHRADLWATLPYRIHAALAPVLAAAVREARAAELREAADEMEATFRAGRLLGGPTDDWLRDRADRIAVDAPEGGA